MKFDYETNRVETILEIEKLDGEAQTARLSDSAVDRDITRLYRLKTKLSKLLGEAKTHPEIEAALPRCEKFFKSMTSEDFCLLLADVDYNDPIYIALWYHASTTMAKAVSKCALFGKDRMLLLYPLWRFYADESDRYCQPRKKSVK